MTSSDFKYYKKAVATAIIGVIISALITGFIFYFSATASIQDILRTLQRHENSIDRKVDQKNFDHFRQDCAIRDANIDRKFNRIDNKLDKIIDYQLNTK